jgi:hypothetical protein
MKKNLLLLCVMFTALFASSQTTPTDLFFSEYIEGSGNNKALEIYNPTDQVIDLNNYYVARYSNGSSVYTEGGFTHLTGTIEPYKTFVLVNGQTTSTATSPACSPVLQAMANQLDGVYPTPTYMNGNDAISLFKTPGGAAPTATNITPVDLIGQIGLGPAITAETGWSYVKDSTLTYNNATGTLVTGKVINYIVQAKATDGAAYGPFWMSWTSDHSLIRKFDVVKGVVVNPVPFKVNVEWDTIHAKIDTATHHWVYKDIWDSLGSHACTADPKFHLAVNDMNGQSSLSIYPNPVNTERFTIKSRVPVKTVEIFNVIGQPVYMEQFTSPRKETKISTGLLDKGLYIVKVIYSNNGSAVQRILVK